MFLVSLFSFAPVLFDVCVVAISVLVWCCCFFFSSRRRHTRCALVTGVQTCAVPICTRFPDRIRGADKDTLSAYAGLTRVLTPTTEVQFGFSYQRGDGYLTDPYKMV